MMLSLLNAPAILGMLTPPATFEYVAVVPGLIVTVTALVVILLDVFHRAETSRDYIGYISAIGLGLAVLSTWALWDDSIATPVFHGMLYADKFGLFFAALCAGVGILSILMSPRYIHAHGMDRGEYYILILFSVVGMIFMANAADLLTIFIALEVMSIPVYVLAGFLRRSSRSAEAGLKYFVLGAFSAALFLYGIALIYGVVGTTNLETIAAFMANVLNNEIAAAAGGKTLFLGVLLVLSGFGFKIAAVPFHLWTPDVYTGSPTPAVGFMATGVKAAALAGLVRVLVVGFFDETARGGFYGYGWIDLLLVMSVGSIVLGNLVAIAQDNVKRMLAYSSIAHAGYILVGIIAANADANFFLYNDTVLFYILAYSFGTLGAFGVLAYFKRKGGEVETYEDIAGLGFKHPTMGLIMTICILSSAGIPPTAGFLGKLYVFRAAIDAGSITGESAFIGLAVLAVLMSVAGMYYYLKVVVYMYMKPQTREVTALEHSGAKFALALAAILSLYLGIFPEKAITLSREAVVDMTGAPAAVQPAIEKGKAMLEARAAGEAIEAIPQID